MGEQESIGQPAEDNIDMESRVVSQARKVGSNRLNSDFAADLHTQLDDPLSHKDSSLGPLKEPTPHSSLASGPKFVQALEREAELSQTFTLQDQSANPSDCLPTTTAQPIQNNRQITYSDIVERQDPAYVHPAVFQKGVAGSPDGNKVHGQHFPLEQRRRTSSSISRRAHHYTHHHRRTVSSSSLSTQSASSESGPPSHKHRGSTSRVLVFRPASPGERASILADRARLMAMHDRYVPTSPLSPQPGRQMSAAQSNQRANHARQTSRNMQQLPQFHPFMWPRHGSVASPSAGTPSPGIATSGPIRQAPSPVVMSRKSRAFLETVNLSSAQAVAQNGKPTSPRLEPLHSPRGPVTPLALGEEEPGDYFAIKATSKPSPAGSPGALSARSDGSSSGENLGAGRSKRKVDVSH